MSATAPAPHEERLKDMTLDTDVKEGVDQETVDAVRAMGSYKYGWDTEIEMDYAPKGLNEEIVRLISSKNEEDHAFVGFLNEDEQILLFSIIKEKM